MRKQLTLAAVLTLALGACGDSGLSAEEVSSIPPGDAVGKALTGLYTVEVTTTACSGTCPTFGSGLLEIALCKVGYHFSQTLTVTQDNGSLSVKLPLGFYVTELKGGVSATGAFDVGGVVTQYSTVQVIGRASGTFNGNGVTGEDRTRGTGNYEGTQINCTGTYSFTGSRK